MPSPPGVIAGTFVFVRRRSHSCVHGRSVRRTHRRSSRIRLDGTWIGPAASCYSRAMPDFGDDPVAAARLCEVSERMVATPRPRDA